jgi:hypothetical protein
MRIHRITNCLSGRQEQQQNQETGVNAVGALVPGLHPVGMTP